MANKKQFLIGVGLTVASVFGAPLLAGATSAAWIVRGVSALRAISMSMGLGLIGKSLQGARREAVDRRVQGAKMNPRSTQANVPVVYGKARIGMATVDVRVIVSDGAVTPGSDPTAIFSGADNNDVLCKVGAFCVGSENGLGIQAINNVRMYDDGVNAITTPAAFSLDASTTGVTAKYRPGGTGDGFLKYTLEAGTDAQVVRTQLDTQLGWTQGSTAVAGRGIAYGAFYCNYDEEVWDQGFPTITADVTGNRVYDPRTPAGGPNSDGYINWSATGASSDNPALCILDYLTSKRYGGAVPYAARDGGGGLDFIDETSFQQAANYCDELVSIPGMLTEKRFVLNGVVPTNRMVGANVLEMLAACRGEIVWQNGKYRLIIREVAASESFELTEDNIIGELKWTRMGTTVPNQMEATFPNNSSGEYDTDSVAWPPASSTTYITEDNGVENRAELALQYVTGKYQAQRIIMTMLKEARQDVSVSLTATQAAYTLEVGDVVDVTHEGPGWVQKSFRVREMILMPEGTVGLSLQSYDAAAYTLATLEEEEVEVATELPNPNRPYTTVSVYDDRFVSSGEVSATTGTQAWRRRLRLQIGAACRSLRVQYSLSRPTVGGGSTAIARDYNVDVTPNELLTVFLSDGAASDQQFWAQDDTGTTIYDSAFAVTITPNDEALAGGLFVGDFGLATTSDTLDLEVEDDVGIRVDAEIATKITEYTGPRDNWVSFAAGVEYIAQQFTIPSGGKDIRSVAFRLRSVGSPVGSIQCFLYSNDAAPAPDTPDASVKIGTSVQANTITTATDGEDVEFFFEEHTLAAGLWWAVLASFPQVSNYIDVGVDASTPSYGLFSEGDEFFAWTSTNTKASAAFAVTETTLQTAPARKLTTQSGLKFSWLPTDGRMALSVQADAAGGAGVGTHGLTDHTDVTLTAPVAGDFLRYSGFEWVNAVISLSDLPAIELTTLTDVNTSTATNRNVLVADGVDWESRALVVADVSDLDTDFATASIVANVTIGSFQKSLLDLSEAAADRIVFFDLSSGVGLGEYEFLTVGTGLNITGATLTATAATYTGGDGIDISVGDVISVDGASGGAGLFSTAFAVGAVTPVAADGIIIGDGGITGKAETVLISQLPFTNNAGTVTSVALATDSGLLLTGTVTVTPTLDLDIVSLGAAVATSPTTLDSLAFHLDGSDTKRILFGSIDLSSFNDDITGGTLTATLGVQRVVDDFRINYGGGANGLIGAAPNTSVTPVALDAILIGDGGLTSAVESIQFSQIPLGIMNDLGYAQVGVDETITGAWTFDSLITGTAGYAFSGVDATAYAAHRILGGTNNPGLFVRATEASKLVEIYASGTVGTNQVLSLGAGGASGVVDIVAAGATVNGTLDVTGTGSTPLALTRTTTSNVAISVTNNDDTLYFGMNSSELFAVNDTADLGSTPAFTVNPTSGNTEIAGTLDVTGAGTFSARLTVNDSIDLSAAGPYMFIHNTAAGLDEKRWQWLASGGYFYLQTRTDVNGAGVDALKFARTVGTTVDYLSVGSRLYVDSQDTVILRATNLDASSGRVPTDLQWDHRIRTSGNYELRSLSGAAATVQTAIQVVHATGDAIFAGDVRADSLTIGGSAVGYYGNRFAGTFTSDGASTAAAHLAISGTVIGAPLDTSWLTVFGSGAGTGGGVTTQSGTEDVIGAVSTLRLGAPTITNNLWDVTLGEVISTTSNGTVNTTLAHGWTGSTQKVYITGHSDANYNGWWTITVVDTDTFTLNGWTGTASGTGGNVYEAGRITRAATLYINDEPTAGKDTGIDEAWGIYTTQSARFGSVTSAGIVPVTDATYALGSATNRWNTIYGTALDITGEFLAGDGSLTDPAYGFTDHAGSGMYYLDATATSLNFALDNGLELSLETNRWAFGGQWTDNTVTSLDTLQLRNTIGSMGILGRTAVSGDFGITHAETDAAIASRILFQGSGNNVLIQGSAGATIATFSSTGLATELAGTLDVTGDLTVSGTGPHAIGGATTPATSLRILGTGAAGTNRAMQMESRIKPAVNTEATLFRVVGTIDEFSSGVHPSFAAAEFVAPTITAGTATITTASTVRITGAPTAGVNNYSLWVGSGATKLGGTLDVTGNLTQGNWSVLSSSGYIQNTAAGTAAKFFRVKSTGGDFYVGIENSAGSFFTGAGAYESVLYSPSNNLWIQSPAVGLSGTLDVTGGETTLSRASTARILTVTNDTAGGNSEIFLRDGSTDRYRIGTTGSGADFRIYDAVGSAAVLTYNQSTTLTTFSGPIAIAGSPASSGALRLTNNDSVNWNNFAGTGNLGIYLGLDDELTVNTVFRPFNDGATNLGTATNRWDVGYFTSLNITNGLVTSVSEATDSGLTIDPVAGSVVVGINYGSGSEALIGAATNLATAPAAIDALLIGEGGITAATKSIQFSQIPLGIMNDLGYAQVGVDETITGAWTFTNDISFSGGAGAIKLREGGADQVYMEFFADAAAPTVRSAYIGFGSAGGDTFSISNEQGDGLLSLSAAGINFEGGALIVSLAGSITAGTWNADTIAVGKGGTGRTTVPGNDEFLVSTGSGYDNSTGLTWNGTTLTATNLAGIGTNITGVNADGVQLTAIVPGTKYLLMTPDATGAAALNVENADLFWTTSTDLLTTVNLDVTGTLDVTGLITATSGIDISGAGGFLNHNNTDNRTKIRVWNSDEYGLGMGSAYTFGGLNNYSMTFQTGVSPGANVARGWWWGTDVDGNDDGSMSLTNTGLLTVASGMRIGYGSPDTTAPTANLLDISGSLDVTGNSTFSGNMHLNNAAGNEMLLLKDTGGAGVLADPYMRFEDSGGTSQGYIGFGSTFNQDMYLSADVGRIELYGKTGVFLRHDNTAVFSTISTTAVRSYVAHHFADGTSTNPGITWTNDQNCGWYRVGSNQISQVGDGAYFQTISAATDLSLYFYQATTQRARLRWNNAAQALVFAMGTGITDRFTLDMSDGTHGLAYFSNTQVYNQEGTEITATGTQTLDWDSYNQVAITNVGVRTINIDDGSMQDGGHYCVVIDYVSGSTTDWTWTETGTLRWQDGAEPVLSNATVGDRTVVTFIKTEGDTLGFWATATV